MEENIVTNNQSTVDQSIYSRLVKSGRRSYRFTLKRSPTGKCYLSVCETRTSVDKNGEPFSESSFIRINPEDARNVLDHVETTTRYITRHAIFTNHKTGLLDMSQNTHQAFVSINTGKRINEITDNVSLLMKCLGFERQPEQVTFSAPSIRTFNLTLDSEKTKEEINDIYENANSALNRALTDRQTIPESDEVAVAAANLIVSLLKVEEALITLGKIFIVKGANAEKSCIVAERCTPRLMFHLKRYPAMLANIGLMFDLMLEEQKEIRHNVPETVR
ncbi:MAG TPA: DUF3276 family protein [Bacteroidales bacterium]|nr:DUF3276 family protein [Bacteroidales bacterium]